MDKISPLRIHRVHCQQISPSPLHTLTVSESLFCKITELKRIWKLAAVASQGMYLVGLPKTTKTPQDSPRSGRW